MRTLQSCAPKGEALPSESVAPIGVFDSGYGGLTVLREIARLMPLEPTIFVGDTLHFPYGPRKLDEVRSYVEAICAYLIERGCKLIVIACNTATAAGLDHAQRLFDVPIVGVVEPGSRAAVYMTRNRRVGVIATQGTVDANAYPAAISSLDAGIKVYSAATPALVDIAEAGLQFKAYPESASPLVADELLVCDRGVLDCDSGALYQTIAQNYLKPLREGGIDTLVLGCTHFPLIEPLIQQAAGENVTLVSSAEETAREVREILLRRGELTTGEQLATGTSASGEPATSAPTVNAVSQAREYLVTGDGVAEFRRFGEVVMGKPLEEVAHLGLWDR